MRCRGAPCATRARTRTRPNTRTLFVVLVAALACTRPVAVSRYALSAREVTARLPGATSALAESCRRAQSYRLRRTGAPWYEEDSTRAACAGRDSALREVLRANHALANYFGALSALAGSNTADVGTRVAQLGDAASSAGPFDESQLRAIAALAKFAAARATSGYKRSKLREAIASENVNVQAVTVALHQVIDRDFASYVMGDDAAATRFYRSVLTEGAGHEPLAAILARNDYDARHDASGAQADALRSLARAIDAIGRGHQQLFDARNHLGAKELLNGIVALARELDGAMARIDKAF